MIVRGPFGENLERGVNNSGFARADRPGHQDEALSAHDRFNHGSQRGSMRVREVKETRIRCEPKRLFPKIIESGVHILV